MISRLLSMSNNRIKSVYLFTASKSNLNPKWQAQWHSITTFQTPDTHHDWNAFHSNRSPFSSVVGMASRADPINTHNSLLVPVQSEWMSSAFMRQQIAMLGSCNLLRPKDSIDLFNRFVKTFELGYVPLWCCFQDQPRKDIITGCIDVCIDQKPQIYSKY